MKKRLCQYCGKEFIVSSKKPNQKFCCKSCADKSYIKDLTGQKFNRLTVLKFDHSDRHTSYWLCQCDCGNLKIVSRKNLISNSVKSCGCLKDESLCKKYPLYRKLTRVLMNIKNRCYNPKTKSYKDYGRRGIKVCNEWLESYFAFYQWALENGYKEGLTIERIDFNKDYSPQNCKWIKKEYQAKNKRDNIVITYNNKTMILKDWATFLNLPYKTLYARYKIYHWSIEKTFNTPIKKFN